MSNIPTILQRMCVERSGRSDVPIDDVELKERILGLLVGLAGKATSGGHPYAGWRLTELDLRYFSEKPECWIYIQYYTHYEADWSAVGEDDGAPRPRCFMVNWQLNLQGRSSDRQDDDHHCGLMYCSEAELAPFFAAMDRAGVFQDLLNKRLLREAMEGVRLSNALDVVELALLGN